MAEGEDLTVNGWEAGTPDAPQRRWRLVAAGVVLVAGLSLLARVQAPERLDDLEVEAAGGRTGTAAVPSSPVATAGAWAELPPSPMAPRVGHTAVWTGHEVLFWGGAGQSGSAVADGASYRPDERRWRAIGPGPATARYGHVAAWSGAEMLVWGGATSTGPFADGYAYDPAADRWRPLPPSPFEGAPVIQLLWTGRYAVAWAAPRVEGGTTAAVYDPAQDAWRVLDPPPDIAWFTPVLAPSGGLVMAWGSVGGIPGPSAAFLLDPATARWTPIDGPPLRWSSGAGLGLPGQVVLFFTGDAFRPGAIWSPAVRRWRPLPALPEAITGASVTWARGEVIVWGGRDPAGRLTRQGTAWSV